MGYGVGCVVNALRRKFLKKLNRAEMPPRQRGIVEKLGTFCEARWRRVEPG